MSKQRANLFEKVCGWVGPAARAVDPREGWPGMAEVQGMVTREVALHVSQVSPHSREEWEYRFQNPDNSKLPIHAKLPVAAPNAAIPILVGVTDPGGKPILVVADGRSRVGRISRFSILFDISIVPRAAVTGWAEYPSTAGERIVAMRPQLLPAFIDALSSGVTLDSRAVEEVAAASGLLDLEDEQSAERTRVAVTRLVRRAAFGRDVCSAYENRCAMCGLGLSLPEGAHIYPASAPGSSDNVWNGLALCRNHHRLFDLRKIWIAPDDRRIVWHPEVINSQATDAATRNFVDNTNRKVALPAKAAHRPRTEMYQKRYELTPALYEWAA